MTCGVYKITAPSGKFYIGSSNKIERRFWNHRNLLKKQRHHCVPMQNAANKHGVDNFCFEIVLICDESNLLFYEQIVIDGLDPFYNVLRTAGRNTGWSHSDETKAKISLSSSGRKMSPETKEKLSRSLKKFYESGTEKSLIALNSKSKTHKNKTVSDESRRKMSESNKNRFSNPEERKRISERMKQSPSNAKLSFEAANSIRMEYAASNSKYGVIVRLARKHGVGKSCINSVLTGKTWVTNG